MADALLNSIAAVGIAFMAAAVLLDALLCFALAAFAGWLLSKGAD